MIQLSEIDSEVQVIMRNDGTFIVRLLRALGADLRTETFRLNRDEAQRLVEILSGMLP